MYNIGEYVVTVTNGICEISEEIDKEVEGTVKSYYLLIPENDKSSKLFIPKEIASKRMRKIMDYEEATELIEKFDSIPEVTIHNEKMCEKEYKEAMLSREPEKVAAVAKTIHKRRLERINQGKKTTTIDEKYFKIAFDMLSSELSYSLGCDISDIKQKINELM